MRTSKLIIALSMGLSLGAHAQGFGEIHGKVLEDGGPSPGAVVTAVQGERRVSTVTDTDGRYLLKPLVPGTYSVVVTAMGMRTTEVTDVRVLPDNNSYVRDVELAPSELGPAIIVRKRWDPPMIENDNTGVAKITSKMLENSPLAKNPVNAIVAYSPGVYKAPSGDGLFFRGSRSENMCYFVDGVKVGSSLSAVPNKAISSMSVYTGGLPAKYGDVTGGVVAIETMSYFDLYQQRNAEQNR